MVKHRVHWPHEAILGGVNRQRVNYDQLSLAQWIQGFTKNIREEKSAAHRDTMIAYLGDLMEDATYFSWQGAKAAHAVLLCEMERGTANWPPSESSSKPTCTPKHTHFSLHHSPGVLRDA